MAYFNKIGLLLLNEDCTKFMVCEKNNFTSDYIMPGGKIDSGESDIDCLVREIKEELDVDTDINSLEYLWEYIDVAAWDVTKDVSIRLFKWKIIWTPTPSQEIIWFQWIDKNWDSRLSAIIKNKILPDLIVRKILL